MTLVSKQPYMYYLFHTIHLPVEANKRRLTTGLVVLSVVTVVDVVVAATATAAAASATACAEDSGHRIHMLSGPRYSHADKSLTENRTTKLI
jgi:hypothetical protein